MYRAIAAHCILSRPSIPLYFSDAFSLLSRRAEKHFRATFSFLFLACRWAERQRSEKKKKKQKGVLCYVYRPALTSPWPRFRLVGSCSAQTRHGVFLVNSPRIPRKCLGAAQCAKGRVKTPCTHLRSDAWAFCGDGFCEADARVQLTARRKNS